MIEYLRDVLKKNKGKLLWPLLAALIVNSALLSGCGVIPADGYSQNAGIVGGADSKTYSVLSDEGADSVSGVDSAAEVDSVSGVDSADDVESAAGLPDEGEFYYDVENVVLYLELYHELPLNYITKEEAEKRGWQGGSVEEYVEDAAIGGDHFGNYEGILQKGDYKECDIDTHNYKNRGSRRLIYTEDGKYYYTKDHYKTFKEVIVDKDYNVTIK